MTCADMRIQGTDPLSETESLEKHSNETERKSTFFFKY